MKLENSYYIAIDPGGTTGWAAFKQDGSLIDMGKIKGENDFLDWLEDQDFEVCIIERYRNRGGKINSFSDMPTSRHIGAIERVCFKKRAKVVKQDPSPCLTIGMRFIGMHKEYLGKHVPDDISALAHGTYFLRKEGILK